MNEKRVRFPCEEHDVWFRHMIKPVGVKPVWCEGGETKTVRWRQRYWHEGTGENGDISTWFVPVGKDERVWVEVTEDKPTQETLLDG